MAKVRTEETQAQLIAHTLDDCIRVPNTAMRFGVDPLIGIVPIVGDALATTMGVSIVLIACRLGVPWADVLQMSYHLLVNGSIGAIPVFGDAFSFWYKSNTKNAAILLKAVAQGEDGACRLVARPFTFMDIIVVLLLTLPIIAMVAYLDWWLWEHQFSIF